MSNQESPASRTVLILAAQVPFTRGGAELLIDGLYQALKSAGHSVDVVSLPFNAEPKAALLKQIALWRSLEVNRFAGREVDLVIPTKFPTYMVKHHNKVPWLIHQHRQVYELYGTRFGDFDTGAQDESLRRMIHQADRQALSECKRLYTISTNVSRRLQRYLGINSEALTPPLPLGEKYYSADAENYILSVGRLCSIKRVDLMLKAMPMIDDRLKLKIVGQPDEPAIDEYLRSEIDKHHLWDRVEFLGRVEEQHLLELFSRAFAVYYAPYDEDYGFVTLEALASARPVITASDSGTVLEFIKDGVNGLVTEPNEKAIADACNRLLDEQGLREKLGKGAAAASKNSTWSEVVQALLGSAAANLEAADAE